MQASGSDKAAAPQANRRASSAKRGAGDFAALLEGGRAQQAGTGPLKPAVIAELRRAASSGGRSTHSQDSDSDQPALQRTGGDPAQSAAGVSAGQTSDPYVDLFTSGEPASEFTRSMEQSGQPDSGQEELKQSAAPVQAQHTEAAGSETPSDGAGTGAPHGSPGAAPSRFASLAGLADALPAVDKLAKEQLESSVGPPSAYLPPSDVSDRAEAPSPEEIPVSSSALSTDETPEPSSKAESLSEGVSVGEAASMSDFEMVEKEQAQVERSRQTTAALSQAVNEAASTSGQNESDEAWRRERKHMFVLSNAGKPVFAAHGDENALAGFMAIIQAMMSFVQDKGDQLQSIRAGLHLVVFVEKGPFYLVAVSATGEPEAALKLQLELLYGQILSILTNGVEKRFAHNPRYDARGLLGGTYTVLRSLKDSFETDPAAMLSAYLPLPLASTLRHAALTTLQAAVKGVNATWGLLLAGDMVVALAQPRASPMHPLDLLLLSNFVRSTDSFRQSESFSPVCLPYFQPAGHMHAYINYLHQEAGLCLVLLSSQPEQFYTVCPEIAQAAQEQLASTGVTEAVAAAMHDDAHRGRLHIADLPKAAGGGSVGTTPLLHFLYKVPSRGQFIMPAICAPLDTQSARQALMPAYARVHAAMFRASEGGASAGLAPQRVHYSQDSERTMLAYVSPEYEVYAVYDALTDKQTAVQLCHKLGSYIKSQQTDLFVP
ncbi:hypothetical protein WJX72_001125 [[Myrmecia] bisecta]|uniref:Vacuolar fusion protein MON1 homolog n=1 Tax=[Myrmecia] bisecta TaxID=41462 RepID=A0AAW1PGA3_9CHLO